MTTEPHLHFIYDPLCGWCYAVAPLVKAARTVIPITLHGGCMMTGARRQKINPGWKAYVGPNKSPDHASDWADIRQSLPERLASDHSAWLDSEPTTAAVLGAERVNAAGLEMLARSYEAHYLEGRRIADEAFLIDLAEEVGLDRGASWRHSACCAELQRSTISQRAVSC